MIVYFCMNKINNNYYIGITKRTLLQRALEHEQSRFISSNPFHRALLKYGPENFRWSIIDHTAKTIEELKQLEIFYIKLFKKSINQSKCYNSTDGGDGILNPSDELRKKLSDSHKGKKQSQETKTKLSKYFKGRKRTNYIRTKPLKEKIILEKKKRISPLKGKKQSQETKDKISKKLKGIKVSQDILEKRSKSLKGKIPWNIGMSKQQMEEYKRNIKCLQ